MEDGPPTKLFFDTINHDDFGQTAEVPLVGIDPEHQTIRFLSMTVDKQGIRNGSCHLIHRYWFVRHHVFPVL